MSDQMPTQKTPQVGQPGAVAPVGPPDSPHGNGGGGGGAPLWVLIVSVLAVAALVGAGVYLWQGGSRADAERAGLESPAATDTGTSESEEAFAAEEEPLVEGKPPARQDLVDSSDPQFGPSAPESYAYLKHMYERGGYWYIVVDYVEVREGDDGIEISNVNPRLRTFPLKDSTRLMLLTGGSTDLYRVVPNAFKSFQGQAGDELVIVTPSGGWAIVVQQAYMP